MEVADGEWRLGRFHFDSIVIIARKLCLNALASCISTGVVGGEAHEVEPFVAPVVSVGQVGPVKTALLRLQALIVSVFRAWEALVGTPPET
jgi:small ligand-binding sensory domain FIST